MTSTTSVAIATMTKTIITLRRLYFIVHYLEDLGRVLKSWAASKEDLGRPMN